MVGRNAGEDDTLGSRHMNMRGNMAPLVTASATGHPYANERRAAVEQAYAFFEQRLYWSCSPGQVLVEQVVER